MSRTLRIILVIVVVLVVLVLVAPFLIPVNQFRPTIEEKASAALGRKVDVGNLSLSLFSGSLAADNLAIADDPKFSKSPFLTANGTIPPSGHRPQSRRGNRRRLHRKRPKSPLQMPTSFQLRNWSSATVA